MNDSLSLDNLSLTAGPTDLGEPKRKPISPAPDDPVPPATAAVIEIAAQPKSLCRELGHSWQPDGSELGSGQHGLAARHYTCNREHCHAKQTSRWDRGLERWVNTVEDQKP